MSEQGDMLNIRQTNKSKRATKELDRVELDSIREMKYIFTRLILNVQEQRIEILTFSPLFFFYDLSLFRDIKT